MPADQARGDPPHARGRTNDRTPARAPRRAIYTGPVLRPPIVAWPDDFTGGLARLGWWVVLALGLVTVLLVRLPERWVAAAFDQPILVRVVLGGVVWMIARTIRPFVISRLPHAAWLFRSTLAVAPRGARRRIPIAEIVQVDVERRPLPVDEVIVVELRDGSIHEVCPLAWDGAARLYEALARRVTG